MKDTHFLKKCETTNFEVWRKTLKKIQSNAFEKSFVFAEILLNYLFEYLIVFFYSVFKEV